MSVGSLPTSSDMLNCLICMEDMQSSGPRIPKALPCQHSFCLDCMKNLENTTYREIQCPMCRTIYRGSADDLRNNLVLIQLIDDSNRSAGPSAPPSTQLNEDPITVIRREYEEPGTVYQALNAYLLVEKSTFMPGHLLVILQCLEGYAYDESLPQPDIIIICMQILDDMVKFTKSMSIGVKERLHKDTMTVLMKDSIQPLVRKSCINILRSLCDEEFQKSYTAANAIVFFKFLNEPLDLQEKTKVIFVLLQNVSTLSTVEKENIGDKRNVKNLLWAIETYWSDNWIVRTLLNILIVLTDLTTIPSTNFVQEGGLDFLQKIFMEPTRRGPASLNPVAIRLLRNISEILDLMKDIIKETALTEAVLAHLISKDITTSVLSAEIIANLSLVQTSGWLQLCGKEDTRKTALTELHKKVASWIKKDPGKAAFDRNSFKPMYPLLQMYSSPPCQMYAAWWIRKCCADSRKRCQEILIKEGGDSILHDIKENEYADKTLRKVIGDIMSSTL